MAKNYVNLDLPPGIRSNGTPYANRGCWIDGSRIRWSGGFARPIGGWERFAIEGKNIPRLFPGDGTETARAAISWRTNEGVAIHAVGTNKKLYAFGNPLPQVHDITPTDFIPRGNQNVAAAGYGNWYYGTASYGIERPYSPDEALAFSWCLRTWGDHLLAAPRGAPSALYKWDKNFGNRAVTVANAPTGFDCFHVTDQRIVMTAGDAGDPRIVKWSDSENLEAWTPTPLNKAGFQNLPGIGKFRSIVTMRDLYLLVSETDAYIARYIGAPFIFGFDQLGKDCGTPSPNGVVVADSFAVWPGYNAFFMTDGATVRRIECPIMDKFAASLNPAYASKTFGFHNPFWPEIWWLYQSGPFNVDSYIAYNYVDNHWSHGSLERTAAAGHADIGGLFMVDPGGFIYKHEIVDVPPVDTSASEVFLLSGPIEIAKGDRTQYVRSIQPDFEGEGVVRISLIGQDRPGGPETVFGPYDVGFPALTNQPVPVRARGHTIKVKMEGRSGNVVLGSTRLDFAVGGEK